MYISIYRSKGSLKIGRLLSIYPYILTETFFNASYSFNK